VANVRNIKRDFFRSPSLALCSIPARLTFQGLWLEADGCGRGYADPRVIKGAIWPLDDAITHTKVDGHLRELAETGHIVLYETAGKRYYAVLGWEKHQSSSYRRGEAQYPAPPGSVEDGPACHVYFMQRADGMVKIGSSLDVPARQRVLESAAGPLEVLLALPGDRVLETELHERFAEARVHGEWFNPVSDLLEYINNAKLCKVVQNRAGREGKGREGKGREGAESASTAPDQFPITAALKEWATKSGCGHLNLKSETAKFLDHHAAKGSRFVDWNRAWQKWMRQAAEWATQNGRGTQQQRPADVAKGAAPMVYDPSEMGPTVRLSGED